MKTNNIPNTDIHVSAICLGTMTFGTPVGEADAIELTHQAIDSGINFIDTANMYEGYARSVGSPGGVAEEILGKALAGRRDNVILATKLGNKVGPLPEDDGTSPAAIRKQLDRSLRKLATDYIDIYYLHKPDVHNTPLAEILGELKTQMDAGKFRYYAISNYSAVQTAELLKVADENHLPRPVLHQPQFSLLQPENREDIFPLCEKEGIGVVPYQVLQGGLLTGKYRRGGEIPSDSRKAESGWLDGFSFNDELFNTLEKIEDDAKAKGRTMTQYAVTACLEQPGVMSVIVGAKRPQQIKDIIAAV